MYRRFRVMVHIYSNKVTYSLPNNYELTFRKKGNTFLYYLHMHNQRVIKPKNIFLDTSQSVTVFIIKHSCAQNTRSITYLQYHSAQLDRILSMGQLKGHYYLTVK